MCHPPPTGDHHLDPQCLYPKGKDLLPLAHSFTDSVQWDILCIQEGVRQRQGGVEVEEAITFISGHGSQVGAPRLILSPRLGTRLRRWILHTNYVIASFGTTPPLIAYSLYLPAFGSHGDAPFEQTLHTFTQDLQTLQEQTPGSLILGGSDCNTQMREMPGHVGSRTGTVERPMDQERADALLHALATLGLKVPSSYVDVGPTRTPWPGQLPRQQPSVIDYLFSSTSLTCNTHTSHPPPPLIRLQTTAPLA